MKTDGKFYLGRLFDLGKSKISKSPLLYDPDDLTTHGVVFGMTGSGKTGLCITLLEEAALNNIPALMIDPKGDIANALLHFPDLQPKDFQPWINPDQARRAKQSVEQAAEATATEWKAGLAEWGITPARIKALGEAAEFTVYTPGSDVGVPVSILASLQAPPLDWKKEREAILERIASTSTALLGLVGFGDVDPVKSREHILLSNIFEHAWSQGNDLELGELILQVQNPPIKTLGVFEVDKFFPAKERDTLAMKLNNILAAPNFQTWLEGEPLDIEKLLFTKEKKPRHSVFVLSHLSDAERMFFVTLLYSAVETWMRSQAGTNSLRAIIYFDEIHGYLPPVAEPPSKGPMLRLLKQARAFGIGQLLATQNPVDVDYKALSNAGTWFIGKLQTEKDKERLLDGLEGAASDGLNRKDYDKMISALDKRVFLLHNVHEQKPVAFHTRWAMNYLAGPITRSQIPALNALANAKPPADLPGNRSTSQRKETNMASTGSANRPALPNGTQEVFLPTELSLAAAAEAARRPLPAESKNPNILYRPGLIAQAQIRYLKRTYNLDHDQNKSVLIEELPERGLIWEDYEVAAVDERTLDRHPQDEAAFGPLSSRLSDAKSFNNLESDFTDWIYRSCEVQIWHNEILALYGDPGLSKEEFLQLCEQESKLQREAEIEKTKTKYDRSLKSLQKKLSGEQRELQEDEAEANQRKMEEIGTHLENVIGLFGGSRRRLTTSLTKRRMTSKAQADVEESKQAIADLEVDIQDMGEEIQDAVNAIHDKWDDAATDVQQIPMAPLKKDIYVSLFGIAWLPYYKVDDGGREMLIPAYKISH
ncbi:MAG: DUF87 domain-containing protein [Chloroflexi bacterium]|nr:DUF87 domain-containing protein [Chloroflexota bacterium]